MHDKFFGNPQRLLKHVPSTHSNLNELYPSQPSAPYEVIFSFIFSLDEMNKEITQAEKDLSSEGMLYLCYPKLKNTLGVTGIHRDHIFPYLEVNEVTGYIKQTLMRFNKMVSFDDNYTVLGVKKDTKQKSRSSTSQKVEDYEKHIKDIKNLLKELPCYDFFNHLTRGYQKGWARYVYSVKTDETKQRRIEEMISLLSQGIKSKDLA